LKKYKIITIPFDRKTKGFDDEPLNRFILNKTVHSLKTKFFKDGDELYWTVFIEYEPVLEETAENIDDGLDEPQRMLLSRLKQWRKERAEKGGVPVYIIGTNKEFTDIVKTAPKTLEALKSIKGFGKSKVSKYGMEIVELIKAFYDKR